MDSRHQDCSLIDHVSRFLTAHCIVKFSEFWWCSRRKWVPISLWEFLFALNSIVEEDIDFDSDVRESVWSEQMCDSCLSPGPGVFVFPKRRKFRYFFFAPYWCNSIMARNEPVWSQKDNDIMKFGHHRLGNFVFTSTLWKLLHVNQNLMSLKSSQEQVWKFPEIGAFQAGKTLPLVPEIIDFSHSWCSDKVNILFSVDSCGHCFVREWLFLSLFNGSNRNLDAKMHTSHSVAFCPSLWSFLGFLSLSLPTCSRWHRMNCLKSARASRIT